MKEKSLDELFALLSRRRLVVRKLVAVDAPNVLVESENKLISNILNKIEKRIDNIDKWEKNFDCFFSKCGDCVHFRGSDDQMFCDKENELPKITSDMKKTECKFFTPE